MDTRCADIELWNPTLKRLEGTPAETLKPELMVFRAQGLG